MVLTERGVPRGADVLVVLEEQRLVVRVQQRADLLLELLLGPERLVDVLGVLVAVGALLVGAGARVVVLLLDVVDVREAGVELPAADGLEDGHVLVVGVVLEAEGVEDVAERFFALFVLLVLCAEGAEGLGVFEEVLV